VEPRQIISSGITASAIVHLSFLMLVIFFTEVHPFGSVTAESIAVDLVTPEEVTEKQEAEKQPEPPPSPKEQASDSFDLASQAAAPDSPPPAAPQQAETKPPQKQAASSPETPASNLMPSPVPSPVPSSASSPAQSSVPSADQQHPAAQPQALSPSPAYIPAQPDLSIKYHVLLGLPQDRPGDGFDAVATEKADVASGPIEEFRRHLKTCSTLPKSVSSSDKIAIKLRVFMAPNGRLAAEPVLIEASASAKGPALMRSAMTALQACQPYAMLPADKYSEWKVLDLNFTPQDFTGAS
jgi:outer membrane biosynthesis protein TonB